MVYRCYKTNEESLGVHIYIDIHKALTVAENYRVRAGSWRTAHLAAINNLLDC